MAEELNILPPHFILLLSIIAWLLYSLRQSKEAKMPLHLNVHTQLTTCWCVLSHTTKKQGH